MATLVHDCPHCHSARMAFVMFGIKSLPTPKGYIGGSAIPGRQATAGLQCQQCFRGAVATINYEKSATTSDWVNRLGHMLGEGISIPSDLWTVASFWPKATPSRIPEFLPDPVSRAFIQGESNLNLADHEEAATTMFRRSLDLALKTKFPELNGSLNAKIKQLAKDRAIPQSLADWAHQVRMIGNDGAHDLEGCTHEDAVAARDFVDAVLRYLFSLPGMIEARRASAEAGGSVDEPEATPS